MKFKKIYFLIVIFLSPTVAIADPLPISFNYGTTLPEWGSLMIESILISIILWRCGFDIVRTFYTWFLITLTTYFALFISLYTIFSLFEFLPSNLIFIIAAITPLFLEILVVWFEAKIMVYISKKKFLRKNSAEPLKLRKAIYISAIVNIVSLFSGGILGALLGH